MQNYNKFTQKYLFFSVQRSLRQWLQSYYCRAIL